MRRTARSSVSRGASGLLRPLLSSIVLAFAISGFALVARQASFTTAAPSHSMRPTNYTYGQGYLFVGSDGSVYNFGTSAYEGGGNNTCPGTGCHAQLDSSFVGVAYAPNASGYWLVGPDGGVFAFPNTLGFYGSMSGCGYSSPASIVAIAAFPNGSGYWLLNQDGQVYSMAGYSGPDSCTSGPWYGNAGSGCYLGGGATTSAVGITATPDGGGYWIAASNGTVYSCGDASNFGTGVSDPAKPISGIVTDTAQWGYWLVGQDGGVFGFGNGGFHGSLPPTAVDNSIVGIAATMTGNGYWLVGNDGGALVYGDAQFDGDMISSTLPAPIVGVAAFP
jgi:hypothetical protein